MCGGHTHLSLLKHKEGVSVCVKNREEVWEYQSVFTVKCHQEVTHILKTAKLLKLEELAWVLILPSLGTGELEPRPLHLSAVHLSEHRDLCKGSWGVWLLLQESLSLLVKLEQGRPLYSPELPEEAKLTLSQL